MAKFFLMTRSLFCLLLIFACKPINIESPQVKSVSIVGDQLIVNGSNFVNIQGLALSDSGGKKTFQVTSVSQSQIIGTAVDNKQIKVPSLLNLIIDTAQGQSTYPVSFSLQADSVTTGTIKNGAVTPEKLSAPGAPDDSVLVWDAPTQQFEYAPYATSGGGGGGVSLINLGKGILGAGGTITTTGTIAVDVGVTSDEPTSSRTIIPYFNSDNKIVMDSSFSPSTSMTGLSFVDGATNFDVYNNTGVLKIVDTGGTELLSLDNAGSMTIKGQPVCLEDGSGCPSSVGSVNSVFGRTGAVVAQADDYSASQVKNIPAGNISATNVQSAINELDTEKIEATGTFISDNLSAFSDTTGKILKDSNIASSDVVTMTAMATGAGKILISQGYNKIVQDSGIPISNIPTMASDATLLYQPILSGGVGKTLVSADYSFPKTDGLPDQILKTDGLGAVTWVDETNGVISFNGRTGAVTSTNTDYNADQITSTPVSGTTVNATTVQGAINQLAVLDSQKLPLTGGTVTGTITTSAPVPLNIGPSGILTGEERFLEIATNGANYVGFRAPTNINSDLVWTLPAAAGASGTVLTTNALNELSWTTVSGGGGGAGDVVGPASSTTGMLAVFADDTGKKIIEGPFKFTPSGYTNGQILQVVGAGTIGYADYKQGTVVPGGTITPDHVPYFSGSAGTQILDSGIDYRDIPTIAATPTDANFPILSVGANKELVAAQYKMPATTGSLGQVLTVTSTGTDWVTNNNGDVTGPGSLTTVGNLVVFNGISGTQISDSLIASAEIPTMAADATGTYQPILSAGANRKQISAGYSIPLGVCPNGQILKSNGANYLCGSDVGGGDVSSSGTFRANVPALFSSTTGKIIIDGEAALMDFDETGAAPAYKEARVFYDSATKALAYYSSSTGLPIEIGQQMVFLARNNTAGNFPKGSAVYVTGAFGGGPNARPTINLAIANSPTTSRVIGITAQAIGPGADGYVTNFGLVRDVNTSGFSEGQILYLSDTASGTFTTTAPALPVVAGRVIYSNTANGIIGVAPVVGAGNVFGPANSLDGSPAIYSGTTGKQLTNTVPYTIPTVTGSSGQVLTTNGLGSTSWTTIAGSGDVLGPATNASGTLALWDGDNSKRLKQTVYTFPESDGTSGQILRTNGSGVVSWVDPPARGVLEYPYEFDTDTSSPIPASGSLKLNSSTPTTANFVYISEQDENNPSVNRASRFLLLRAGDLLDITSSDNGNNDYLYTVSATPTDAGSYIEIPVTAQTISGIISDRKKVTVALVYKTPTPYITPLEASDPRIKKEVRPLESSLDNILKLNPIRYKPKYENDQSDQLGLNALEVQKLFPDLIATVPPPLNSNIKEEILGINYSKMVIPLIKAFQEKSKSDEKTIQMLTERIERLEKIVSEKAKR